MHRWSMPTRHPRKLVPFTEEDLHALAALHVELQKPGRRGSANYLPLKVTLNQFIAKLAMERAKQVRGELQSERKISAKHG